jgi:hypothetical protein
MRSSFPTLPSLTRGCSVMESGAHGDRELAQQRFVQAQHDLDKGHLDRAEDSAKEALEFDSSYDEVRMWLADLYLSQDEPYLASRQLQDVIYRDRGNEEAWAKLGQVDPASALRIKTIGEIAPDPFVSTHRAELEGEFEELGDDDDGAAEEVGWGSRPDPATLAADLLEEEEAEIEVEGDDDYPEDLSEPPPEEAPTAPARGPAPWEYEQDRAFLQRWLSDERIAAMTASLREMWEEATKLVPAYQHAAHMERSRHPEIAAEAEKCMRKLGVDDCELLMVAERSLYPVPMQDQPARLAIPTGLLRGMTGAELEFHLGREFEYIRSGYLAEWHIAELVVDRPVRLVGDETTETLRALLHDLMREHENAIKRDERERLVKLGHAWQQRAALSADRAGWLCCGDLDAACLAIAKATGRTLDDATKMTLAGFLAQFKDADAAKLAAIPPKELPDRSPSYAAYRIQMLRWWASTPPARALREQFAQL